MMGDAFEIRNEISDELEVWIEPWCHPYRIPRGSVLKLGYLPSADSPLRLELTPERLVVWPNSRHAPTATLDGKATGPDFGVPLERAKGIEPSS